MEHKGVMSMITTDVSIRELMIRQEQEITLHRCRHAWHRREYLARQRKTQRRKGHEKVSWLGSFDALGQALLKK